MGTFDYFVGTLRCPVCGNTSRADDSTNMQTKIREKSRLDLLGVGVHLHVDQKNAERAGYLTIQLPKPNEPIFVLDIWECPFCNTTYNWARIMIQDEIIKEVSSVAKTRHILTQCHFVSDECLLGLAADLGFSYKNIPRNKLIGIILEKL